MVKGGINGQHENDWMLKGNLLQILKIKMLIDSCV